MSRLSHKSLIAIGVSDGKSGEIELWELVDDIHGARVGTTNELTPVTASHRFLEVSRGAAASKTTTILILMFAFLCYILPSIKLKGAESPSGKEEAGWSMQEAVLQDFLSNLNV
jgi:hypothetical protein